MSELYGARRWSWQYSALLPSELLVIITAACDGATSRVCSADAAGPAANDIFTLDPAQ
jgi:hypothetical protein